MNNQTKVFPRKLAVLNSYTGCSRLSGDAEKCPNRAIIVIAIHDHHQAGKWYIVLLCLEHAKQSNDIKMSDVLNNEAPSAWDMVNE